MNLRVHGLEGNIAGGVLTYYDDLHDGLWGNADFVMVNPPFNIDEVDAEKIKNDRRLPFGLPGVNKQGKVFNGNYLWISYFYSYLNETGRAGFVMSSQASSAGGGEAKVRQALVETGHVDAMIDIRSNFFYTRTVPCQLWFLNKNKAASKNGKAHKDKVLMLDARNIYRKIYGFSPQQLANLTSIVWLYRGESQRFIELLQDHIQNTLDHAWTAFSMDIAEDGKQEQYQPIAECIMVMESIEEAITPFYQQQSEEQQAHLTEFSETLATLKADAETFEAAVDKATEKWQGSSFDTSKKLNKLIDKGGMVEQLSEISRDFIKQLDLTCKFASRLIETAEKELKAKEAGNWDSKALNSGKESLKKQAEAARAEALEELKQVRYSYKHAHWLASHFPDAELVDVEGLVKLVDVKEIEANDWSLTPGRYVGVAPEEEDEDFDFEETLRDIHVELLGLNNEAVVLAEKIAQNFVELGL